MLSRIFRAFKNDVALYPEIKGKPEIQSESFIAILSIVGLTAAFTLILGLLFPTPNTPGGDLPSVANALINGLTSVFANLVGYMVLTGWAWLIGVVVGKGQGSFNDVRGALAYGEAPMLLSPLPFVGWIFALWSLVTSSSAIRETLGIGKGLTFFIVLSAGVIQVFVVATLIGTMMAALLIPFFL